MRTRQWPSLDSQSESSTTLPSASEQQGPLSLVSFSNHGFSGELAKRPSGSRAYADCRTTKIMTRTTEDLIHETIDFPFSRSARQKKLNADANRFCPVTTRI